MILVYLFVSILLVLVIRYVQKKPPSLLYNPTDSARIGWYKVVRTEDYKVGDIVAAYLPKDAGFLAAERGYLPSDLPVIKTVAAIAGDEFCVSEAQLTFEDGSSVPILPFDGQGRALPAMSEGCVVICEGHVLLISDQTDRSFDSRYFGAIRTDRILGLANFLGKFPWSDASECSDMGGARGVGAQGKIKAASALGALLPCLHINFQGAEKLGFAPILGISPIVSECLHSTKSRAVSPGHPSHL